MAEVRVPGMLVIEARNAQGERRRKGGDAFEVSIRGFSAVQDVTTDVGDGTYTVEYNVPGPSGTYKVAVLLDGKPLPGSPFKLKVAPSTDPYAGTPPPEDKKAKRGKKGGKKKGAKAAGKARATPPKSEPGAGVSAPGSAAVTRPKAGSSEEARRADESDSETSSEDDSPGTSDSSSDDEKQKKKAVRA